MSELHPVLKKLNVKHPGQSALILNAPEAYAEAMAAFQGDVHTVAERDRYEFVQAFGTSNAELREAARIGAAVIEPDGLLWLCYPKKSSAAYKGSDCGRETVAGLLAEEGYEPVRQVAIDDDWSALRFRKPEQIKRMVRAFAVTDAGKQKAEAQRTTKQEKE